MIFIFFFFVPFVVFLFLFVLCRDAAEAAGFRVLRLIHEPAAALLAYNIGQDCSSGKRYKHTFTFNNQVCVCLNANTAVF